MRYSAETPPDNVSDDLRRFLSDETQKIDGVLRSPTFGIIDADLQQALPIKPRVGMVANFAAGVAGVSEGLYRYDSTLAWIFVG